MDRYRDDEIRKVKAGMVSSPERSTDGMGYSGTRRGRVAVSETCRNIQRRKPSEARTGRAPLQSASGRRASSSALRHSWILWLPVLAIPLVCLWASAAELDAQSSRAERHVPVCLLIPIFKGLETGPDEYASRKAQVFSPMTLRWAAAALLGVEHVNLRNCSVVGPGCRSWLGGVKIRPLLYE